MILINITIKTSQKLNQKKPKTKEKRWKSYLHLWVLKMNQLL